jgi:serine/threonine/tyrosine-interacting protein
MEDEIGNPPSMVGNTMPSAPYSHRPPSPPFIHIPSTGHCGNLVTPNLVPSFENVDPAQLTAEDVLIITRNMKQTATDRTFDWSYEKRREAQELTDFLYLGPNRVARDHDWLRRTGITMILVARDVRMGNTKLNSVEKAAEALGITLQYVSIGGCAELISTFSHAVRTINDHLLSIYHRQAQQINRDGSMTIDSSNFTRGKVLFTCETGNDRSAVLAAAYIMAVFGKDMVTVLQFIGISRFCCTFDEDMKRKLQSWEDLTRARAQVANTPQNVPHAKRQIDDYYHDDESDPNEMSMDVDRDRFEGRGTFAPFVDM